MLSFVRWHGGRDSTGRLAPRAEVLLVCWYGLHQRVDWRVTSVASANGRTAHSYHAHHALRLGWGSMRRN